MGGLTSAVFTTSEHVIDIEKEEDGKWSLKVYSIIHGMKEIIESQNVTSYLTAYMYIDNKYLHKEELSV